MKTKLETGWHNLSDQKYFGYPAVSNSTLKSVHTGGTAWANARNQQPWRPSEAMQKGTALHYALFDPEAFLLEVIERPTFSGTGSQAKRREWAAEHVGKIVLGPADYDQVCRAADLGRLYAGPFQDGRMEVAGIYDDGDCARKIKVDYLTDDVIWDVKGCASVDQRKFTYQARDLHYDIQAAWYADTAYRIDGKDRAFRWLCIKNSDPIDVRIYQADEHSTIQSGRAKWNAALDAWTQAKQTGQFTPKIEYLDLEDV